MLRAARGALCRAARHPLLQAGGLEAPAGGATPAFARASAAAAAQAQRIDDTDDEVRRCRPPTPLIARGARDGRACPFCFRLPLSAFSRQLRAAARAPARPRAARSALP